MLEEITSVIYSSIPPYGFRKERLSSDTFSCSMAAMCLKTAETHERVVLGVKSTVKDLRVLLVRRKENALHAPQSSTFVE
jgi:hypothetical protein